jgi:hypothetical protein
MLSSRGLPTIVFRGGVAVAGRDRETGGGGLRDTEVYVGERTPKVRRGSVVEVARKREKEDKKPKMIE